MSRVTAPVSKQLSRSIGAASSVVARPGSGALLDHNAGAVLMPKYAELLRSRRSNDHSDSSRGLTTTHRPTPQPSIAHRTKPLMQTFHSSPSPAAPSTHLDATVLPSRDALYAPKPASFEPPVPILPDNYTATSPLAMEPDTSVSPGVTIVASHPERVMPSTVLSGVEAVGLDGVDLKFAHESEPASSKNEGGMLSDLWKGMVEDVFGQAANPAKKAL